jgi:hypothetical protein
MSLVEFVLIVLLIVGLAALLVPRVVWAGIALVLMVAGWLAVTVVYEVLTVVRACRRGFRPGVR